MIDWRDMRITFGPDGKPITGEIVYSHVDNETGVLRHFAVERICKAIEAGRITPEIVEFPIDPKFAMYVRVHRGVEAHRLARITVLDLAHYPVLMAHFPGVGTDMDENLMIDGHHRYVRAWMFGWKTMRAYVLPEDVWSPYLINVPEELLAEGHNAEALSNQHKKPIDSRIK